MPKKAARKKTVTKSTKVTRRVKAVKSFTLSDKQDSYLPLLLVILFASVIFLLIALTF